MASGKITTYDLTVGIKLDFEDVIYLLSPFDVPLQGTSDNSGRSTLATGTCVEKLVQWEDETLLTQRSALFGNGGSITNVATTLIITTGDGIKFDTGDVILIDAEYIRITSVATDTLTVVRGYGGSTAASHNDGAVVVGVGQTLPEGSDPNAARSIDRNNRSNFTQIFGPWQVQTSGTEDAIQKYGLASTEFDHQVGNRMKEMAVTMEQALLYGLKFEDTGNRWRTFGGIDFWTTTNVDSTTTTLTESALLAQLQACYDAGGAPDRIVVGSKQKRVISNINQTQIRYANQDDLRGQIVEAYDSDFGRQSVILDRWCRTANLYIFNRDQAEVDTLRPMQFEMLAKTGDSTKGQVVQEKTFKFRRQSHAAKFNALT